MATDVASKCVDFGNRSDPEKNTGNAPPTTPGFRADFFREYVRVRMKKYFICAFAFGVAACLPTDNSSNPDPNNQNGSLRDLSLAIRGAWKSEEFRTTPGDPNVFYFQFNRDMTYRSRKIKYNGCPYDVPREDQIVACDGWYASTTGDSGIWSTDETMVNLKDHTTDSVKNVVAVEASTDSSLTLTWAAMGTLHFLKIQSANIFDIVF